MFSIIQSYKDSQFNNAKIKSSKIQVQNKTQTLRKSYTFLNKVLTRRGHKNINNNNNKICIKQIEREKRESKKKDDRHILDAFFSY